MILLPLPDGSYKAYMPVEVVTNAGSASDASLVSGSSTTNISVPNNM